LWQNIVVKLTILAPRPSHWNATVEATFVTLRSFMQCDKNPYTVLEAKTMETKLVYFCREVCVTITMSTVLDAKFMALLKRFKS
jgi:hypothetical protein